MNSGSSPAGWFPCHKLLWTSPSFLLSRVCASRDWTTIVRQDMDTLLEQGANENVHQNWCLCYCCRHINFTDSDSGFAYYDTCEKEVADEGVGGYCLKRRSIVGAQKTIVMRNLQFVSIADFSGFLCKVSTRQKRRWHIFCVFLLLFVVTSRSSPCHTLKNVSFGF